MQASHSSFSTLHDRLPNPMWETLKFQPLLGVGCRVFKGHFSDVAIDSVHENVSSSSNVIRKGFSSIFQENYMFKKTF